MGRTPAQLPAPVLVLGAVLSVQFGQALGKQMFDLVEPMGVAALRLGLAAAVLLAVYRPALPRTGAEWRGVAGFGTAIAGMNLIYPALLYLPLGLAISLQLLGPITLALLASRRALDVCLAALAGVGIWLFHAPGDTLFRLPGVLLALAGGVSMALYLLLSKRAGARSTGGGPLAPAVAWAAVLTLPFGVWQAGTALLEPRVLASGLVVAVVSAVLPYSLELAALRRLPPRVVGVLQSLEPAVAGLAGTLLLSEHLGVLQWLALACVGAAAAGTVAGARSTARRAPRPPLPDGTGTGDAAAPGDATAPGGRSRPGGVREARPGGVREARAPQRQLQRRDRPEEPGLRPR